MLSVQRGLKEIFDLSIPKQCMYRFKEILASYYTELRKEILESVLRADVIHIGQVRSLLDKWVGGAVTVAPVTGALRALKSLSISVRIALS